MEKSPLGDKFVVVHLALFLMPAYNSSLELLCCHGANKEFLYRDFCKAGDGGINAT